MGRGEERERWVDGKNEEKRGKTSCFFEVSLLIFDIEELNISQNDVDGNE